MIPVVEVTINTYLLIKVFSKIMIEGQEELIRLLSVEGQPTKAVLAQTRKGLFFILSMSDTVSAVLFLPKPPADHRRPPCKSSWTTGGPQTTVRKALYYLIPHKMDR
jgi:hypothetical protein